ncbi:hypothetical protein GC175_04980 [bacterium]|nr:hypothetical protein [bacterium]
MTNNSTTSNHVQAVSPEESHRQLTATSDLLRVELEERVAQLDDLATQLYGLQKILEQLETQARPLVDAFNQLYREINTRMIVLDGLAHLGAGAIPDIDIEVPGIVRKFSQYGRSEEDIPF